LGRSSDGDDDERVIGEGDGDDYDSVRVDNRGAVNKENSSEDEEQAA
jgi:hypothetical protein